MTKLYQLVIAPTTLGTIEDLHDCAAAPNRVFTTLAKAQAVIDAELAAMTVFKAVAKAGPPEWTNPEPGVWAIGGSIPALLRASYEVHEVELED